MKEVEVKIPLGSINEKSNCLVGAGCFYVIPAQAGIQAKKTFLDSRLRGNDKLGMRKLPDP
jgi:hypothetical protein